jgi:histidine triad (HIT) family protein
MSLSGVYDPGNIFAKILSGAAPCAKAYEDGGALAFMDLFPQSPGHTLVIPKNVQARNFLDMPADRLGAYMQSVQIVAAGVVKAFNPDGLIITQFNGAPAGQTVFHLHMHLIPRYDGAALAGHGAAAKATAEELQKHAAAIAAAIAAP